MPESTKTIRIFISSPSDVSEERDGARRVINGLQRSYTKARLEPVLWEELALPATASFQDTIDYLLEREPIDIAVFILWSRLGSPLGASITRPDGTPYRSGTEREFDLMLEAFEQSEDNRPVILAYVRDDKDGVLDRFDQTDDSQWEELITQRRLVKSFIREQFQDADGHNIRAYQSYSEPIGFLDQLRAHLRRTLNDMLEADPSATWTEEPYRGLEVFDVDHAPIFYGRDEPTYELLQRLRDRKREGCAFVVIVGPSGSGKSSLARAGVAASLVQLAVDPEGVKWQLASFIPTLADQSLCHALVGSLAEVLSDLVDSNVPADRIAKGLAENGSLTVQLTIAPAFERSDKPTRLLLVLDQMEELWTDRRISQEEREQFLSAVEALASSGHISVLATLRSDFYHHAQASSTFLKLKGTTGQYDLLAPDSASIHHVIVEPARLSGLKFERNEQTGRSLDELILDDAGRESDSLPLLEYLLSELYRQRDIERCLLTYAAYVELGGVEGAIGKRADETFASLPAEAQESLDEILPLLISVDISGEQSAVRRRAEVSMLTSTPGRKQLVDGLIKARFLTTDRLDNRPIAGFAHEALLRSWDRVVSWIRINRDQLALRARVEQSQQRWEQQGRHESLLLADGLPLDEGRQLVREAHNLLSEATQGYIEDSIAHHDRKERQGRRKRAAVQTTITVLLVAIIATALFMRWSNARQKRIAEAEARITSLMTARPDAVPAEIKLLEPLKDHAIKKLPQIAGDESEDVQNRFRAMCALANFGILTPSQVEFLVDLIPKTNAGDSANLVQALKGNQDYAVKLLRERFDSEHNEALRVRWATALLSRGVPDSVQQLLELNKDPKRDWGADPSQRTSFLYHFQVWPGDRSALCDTIRNHKGAEFRSGLCAAIGTLPVDSFRIDTKVDLETLFRELHTSAKDASVRSAAEFALKKWEARLPEIQTAKKALADSNWFCNDLGMIMIRVPSGEFKMGSDFPEHPKNEMPLPELVKVDAFYLCDREVTQAQYREFLVWKSKQNGEQVAPPHSAYVPDHPFHEAGYYSAVDFCNYLNIRMGLDDSSSTGLYRLPTEAEWEYACRAKTHTDFSCGDQTHLDDYAVLQRSKPASCASKLPNAWGFFDMHGNAHEWCIDQYRDSYRDTVLQPERVHRGGWWSLEFQDARSALRRSSSSDPDYEDGFGFRVALDCK